jgi:dihydrofolate reductase
VHKRRQNSLRTTKEPRRAPKLRGGGGGKSEARRIPFRVDRLELAGGAGYDDQAQFGHDFRTFTSPEWALPEERRALMGKVVLYSTVSVDGFIADEHDQPGPLFDWLSSGNVPLDETGELTVSQASYDLTRAYWDQIGVTIVGRRVFDLTDGWGGTPPSGIDHVVVVSHRAAPEGWHPEAPFHFVDGVEAAMAKAQELAGGRTVEVAAGDVGGQVLAAGLVDEVAMDVAPVVLGSGKRYFGSVVAEHLLEDPDVVIQGNRVLHVRYQVRR